MNHIRKKDHIYDVVVVGAGLPGLVTAVSLIRKGLDVCVLESTEFPGGHSRSVYSPIGLVDNGIKFFPDNQQAADALESLNALLTHPIEWGSVENGPITYHNGELKPFVGFGKEAPDFHRELSYFLEPRRLETSRQLGLMVADLASQLGERFYPGSIVTKYLGHESSIHSVMVNGQKQINGLHFIHAASPKFLATLLSDEVVSARAKQKIAKAEYWTALGLDLFFKGEVSERSELHLLNGTTQDDLGPCVGLFNPAAPSEKLNGEMLQHSQWMTFVENESSEDPEVIGSILKKIKRQIKRAYPEAMDKVYSERILVAPFAEAELDLKFEKNGALSGVKNLWLAHGTATGERNIVGSILQGLKVAENFGTDPVTAEAELSEG
jgi:uncharacterized protein with NAD-binding domain and iron-sulfur cluster